MSGSISLSVYISEERRSEVSCDVHEMELWTAKILLHCLENVVLGTNAPPKISQETVASVQSMLINLKTKFRDNPFLEVKGYTRKNKTALEKDSYLRQMGLGNISALELSVQQLSLTGEGGKGPVGPLVPLSDITFESKVVLRTLVSAQIRKLAKEIIRLHLPMLEKEGYRYCDGSEDDKDTAETLSKIIWVLQNLKNDCTKLDRELQEVQEEIKIETELVETNLLECSNMVDRHMEHLSSEYHPDKISRYEEYLRRSDDNLALKKRVLDLEIQIDSNPSSLSKQIAENFVMIQNEVLKLEKETNKTETLLEEYGALGPEYTELLRQYEAVEDKIATKEWVIKQYNLNESNASLFDV